MSDDTAQPRYIGWRYWAAGKMDLDGEIRPVLISPATSGIDARWLDTTTHTSTCTAPIWARHSEPACPDCGRHVGGAKHPWQHARGCSSYAAHPQSIAAQADRRN